jgi:hypothetical protein
VTALVSRLSHAFEAGDAAIKRVKDITAVLDKYGIAMPGGTNGYGEPQVWSVEDRVTIACIAAVDDEDTNDLAAARAEIGRLKSYGRSPSSRIPDDYDSDNE